ncbi:MAG: cytochrome b/b6 domain-containing protein [Granulosicoccaceae bacterium]
MSQSNRTPIRYNDAAVILHWLIALLLIGLLMLGKYMHMLEDDDPQKFVLVQLHKSFGVIALLLIFVRLIWRMTYTPPAHPANAPKWEKLAAKSTHILLYTLMLTMPLSGWLMVSASPLNIDTILFGAIKWPHVPGAQQLQEKELSQLFHTIHAYASGAMILLIIMHVGAALKHHIINKDDVLRRMAPDWQSRSFKPKFVAVLAAISMTAGGFALIANSKQAPAVVVTANNSNISFNTIVTGEATPGQFNESTITLTLDDNNPDGSSLIAEVNTASVFTDNYQVNGSLPDADWLDDAQHPIATFVSESITKTADGYLVKGAMAIKNISYNIEFPMSITELDGKNVASGQFIINRFDYKLGVSAQPDEAYVGADITIEFSFEL